MLIEVLAPAAPAAHLVIRIAGEIDMDTSDQVQRVVADAVDRHRPRRVSLEMGGVTFVDSSGTRALVACHEHAARLGAALEISQAHPYLRQVLAITDLLGMFHL
ncbi:STAS domain-containing protein [Actinoplanes sp. KI2]|uniref:STAS domain-containing protein n=1 Tax=Actinoplanes sp. KI2 TaxID=2983315 RepID=UPI0021D5A179|nr:STAS domain-containing protein [Actinoplanes sp. KI2]MCU7723859.1 STAS domain-containing protein [Actinoplanes sp. KI2]